MGRSAERLLVGLHVSTAPGSATAREATSLQLLRAAASSLSGVAASLTEAFTLAGDVAGSVRVEFAVVFEARSLRVDSVHPRLGKTHCYAEVGVTSAPPASPMPLHCSDHLRKLGS